ncbi:hypothetical protein DMH04_11050 [Kibdelosporangium aridum]|uniref:Uncharacterized protein n=1 Tax=Kibdelosporangium aridum TaxID=2030 RepID=A0A428ZHH9_KIBAR|nr:hypothetical protein [Kibdelosporangium aridum]RSM87539.1 hypothetical protein DMH04_11050 [Kibdelosporangium aridum]
MTAVAVDGLTGRSLVTGELFERLTHRVVRDEGYEPPLAVRVVDQALAFLGACAAGDGRPMSPSRLVDPGWHAFVLHTRDYREFCDRVAGRFIDHVPTDDARAGVGEPAVALHRTVDAMRAAGYVVDHDLWFASGRAKCSQCHNGCADDPPPPPAVR